MSVKWKSGGLAAVLIGHRPRRLGPFSKLSHVVGATTVGTWSFFVAAIVWLDDDPWGLSVDAPHILTEYIVELEPLRTVAGQIPEPLPSQGLRGGTARLYRGDDLSFYLHNLEMLKRWGVEKEQEYHYYTDFWAAGKAMTRKFNRHLSGRLQSDIMKILESISLDENERRKAADLVVELVLEVARRGWSAGLKKTPAITYKTWKLSNKGKDAIAFVKEQYGEYIKLGMTQGDLKKLDHKGYEAFHNRCRYLECDPGRIIPSSHEDLDKVLKEYGRPPSYAESVGRSFREASYEAKRLTRVYRGLQRRRSEARKRGPLGPS